MRRETAMTDVAAGSRAGRDRAAGDRPGRGARSRCCGSATPGARPKAYLQAGLHADELPGMLVLRVLAGLLEREEVSGEVVMVPVANPIGLAQQVQGYLRGRYEANSAGNFNRGYADLAESVAAGAGGAAGRRCRGERRGGAGGDGRGARRRSSRRARSRCCGTRCCAWRSTPTSCSTCMRTTRRCCISTSARRSGRTRRISRRSSGRGRCCWRRCPGATPSTRPAAGRGGRWRGAFRRRAIPPACLAATVELRSNNAVDARLAEDDAHALLRFLTGAGWWRGGWASAAGAARARRRRSTPCSR